MTQEGGSNSDLKKFDLTNNWTGNDMSTLTGRLRHFWEIVSPEKCLFTDSTIKGYQSKVDKIVAERGDKDGYGMLT
jgi:hypothetical protein